MEIRGMKIDNTVNPSPYLLFLVTFLKFDPIKFRKYRFQIKQKTVEGKNKLLAGLAMTGNTMLDHFLDRYDLVPTGKWTDNSKLERTERKINANLRRITTPEEQAKQRQLIEVLGKLKQQTSVERKKDEKITAIQGKVRETLGLILRPDLAPPTDLRLIVRLEELVTKLKNVSLPNFSRVLPYTIAQQAGLFLTPGIVFWFNKDRRYVLTEEYDDSKTAEDFLLVAMAAAFRDGSLMWLRQCRSCDVIFVATHLRDQSCSDKCRYRYHDRLREERGEFVRLRRKNRKVKIKEARKLLEAEKDKYEDRPEVLFRKVKEKTELSKKDLMKVALPILGDVRDLL
jgi:hypothetical protein